MLSAVEARDLGLHSLLVIRNGYLVSETYFGAYQSDTRHETFSVTKSFIATLVGVAVRQGVIDRIERPIADYLPGEVAASLKPEQKAISVQDLLTMRTGLDWQEDDVTISAMARSPDWVQFVLDRPMARPPGQTFNYCTGCMHLLSAALEQAAGTDLRDFAEAQLFEPLGISNVRWQTDAQGIPIGGWGLQLTPRDMAKLGYLYLQDGTWAGQPIISPEWAESATRTHVAAGEQGYGYLWWTYPTLGAYAALGRGGQTILVVPDDRLIVVTTAENQGHAEIFDLIEQSVLPAVQNSD